MRTGFITTSILIGVMAVLSCPAAADTDMRYPIMQPDQDTIARWVGDYLAADELRLEGGTSRGSVSLLSHLDYVTADRNQGGCGNCWAWAGTGCMEIAHHINYGVFDRLSVQYLNSCYHDGGGSGGYACCGGWLSSFVGFYSGTMIAVPWSNTNAQWQDGGTSCTSGSTTRDCATIGTTPSYGITSIGMYRIPTRGDVSQAEAIANIKAALNNNQAVWFAFYLPDFGPFFDFWSGAGASETDVWSFDYSCGSAYEGDNKGGHAILCVGYNDDDPDNSYWIMVNSWGTAGGLRPNGILRVDMDMNYSCALPGLNAESEEYSLFWQTLSVTFDNSQPICDCNGPYSAECEGGTTQVQLDGSASTDPDQDELSFAWTSDCPGASFDDSTSETPTLTVDSISPCPLECNVTLTVSDDGGLSDTCSTTVTVSDTTPPRVTIEAGDETVECDGAGNTEALNKWLGTHGGASAVDTCGGVTWSDDFPGLSNGCCATGSAKVIFTATDDCGLMDSTTGSFAIEDTTPPSILTPASDMTVECDGEGNADDLDGWLNNHGGAVASDVCCGDDITWTHTPAQLSDDCCETGSATVTFTATDGCGNASTTDATFTIVDTTPPEITCPGDITLERGDKLCNSDVQDWLDSTTATDICCGDDEITIVEDSAANGYECGFPYDSTTEVTWTATDDCGNSSQCSAFITIKQAPRVDMTRKGSLLIFSKVELRWNASGELTQDTFLDITNDYPGWVAVQMYFFNGDPPTAAGANDRAHLGWNWVDNAITLTGDQPAYWSAATGDPKGVSPFTILDPSADPLLQGRPCCDGTGERMLRGMVLAWAVNPVGEEIRWNHLKGDALLVNYEDHAAWEYGAWSFSTRCLGQGEQPLDCVDFDANGVCCAADVIPGNLDLDAFQYDLSFDQLILDFYAPGAGYPGGVETIDGDLTLFPVDIDLRQETLGPVTTKAKFDIWNMNEVKFSNTERCITGWDQELLSVYEAPNSFLREHLQTNKGKARIDGMQSMLCPGSVEASLLGVSMKLLGFNAGIDVGMAGNNLFGAGYQSGRIQYDPTDEPPPELVQPTQPVGRSPELGSVGAREQETAKGVR